MTQTHFHVYIYGPDGGPLPSRFEDVCQRLDQVDRLHMELDGSFVWVGPNWQLDGMIYDHADQIRYVDLKGHCPHQRWNTLLNWLTNPLDNQTAQPTAQPTAPRPAVTIREANGQVLHDLQDFETLHWPQK
jgi:hypothetical protein